MSAPFTPEQEARLREIVDEQLIKRAPDLTAAIWPRVRAQLTGRGKTS